jgi:hypothetical protein
MTTLMVLMAGLVLNSDGTEGISTKAEQRLAIAGYWEGMVQFAIGETPNAELRTLQVRFDRGWYVGAWGVDCKWTDEGRGRCRFTIDGKQNGYGIYKRESGQLVICYVQVGSRPTRFRAERDQVLLILKPASPPGK